MSTPTPPRRNRRPGYFAGIVVNAILLFLVNTWPGWTAVPFLTDAASDAVGWVNISLWFGIASNAVYLIRDPRWLRELGSTISTAISLVVLLSLVRTFPFDFGDSTFDWAFWVRAWLWFLIIAVGIGLLAQTVGFLRTVITGRDDE